MARQEEFQTLGANLVLVSFGVREGAQCWLQETECPFPMLVDSHRKLYELFGLKKSVFMVWGVSCLVFYAEQMRAGTFLPSPYKNMQDDVYQMGGDFIVTAEGKRIFNYCSQSSADRPTVDTLLHVLAKSQDV